MSGQMASFYRATRSLQCEQLETRQLLASDVYQPAFPIAPEEQLLVELINRARANPVLEAQRYGIGLNDNLPSSSQITSVPKQPLAPVAALQIAAELHSKDMLQRDYFSHDAKAPAPNGVSPSDRAVNAGYSGGAGENLALNPENGRGLAALVEDSHALLIRSAGHRQNLMHDSYRDLGIGIEMGDYNYSSGTFRSMMVTEKFGLGSSNRIAITGVVYSDTLTADDFYTIGEGVAGVEIVATAVDGSTYRTTTSSSGGYAVRLPNGSYQVQANLIGGGVRILGSVSVNGRNIKIDVDVSDSVLQNPNTDVNQDLKVDAKDLLLVVNYLSMSRRNPSAAVFEARLDVNSDNKISALDLLAIVQEMVNQNRLRRMQIAERADAVFASSFSEVQETSLDTIENQLKKRRGISL